MDPRISSQIKMRKGRWSRAQSNLFEDLLEKYGKNWIKIHEHMRLRSLCQIRSHAQKFFEKLSPRKAQEYRRKAQVLEAYETLQKEKRLQQEEAHNENPSEERQQSQAVKQEEQISFERHPVEEQSLTCLHQSAKQSHTNKKVKEEDMNEDEDKPSATLRVFSQLVPYVASQSGFLMNVINLHPQLLPSYGLGLDNSTGMVSYPQHMFFPGCKK